MTGTGTPTCLGHACCQPPPLLQRVWEPRVPTPGMGAQVTQRQTDRERCDEFRHSSSRESTEIQTGSKQPPRHLPRQFANMGGDRETGALYLPVSPQDVSQGWGGCLSHHYLSLTTCS